MISMVGVTTVPVGIKKLKNGISRYNNINAVHIMIPFTIVSVFMLPNFMIDFIAYSFSSK